MDNILRNNLIFWSRLGFGYDPPLFDEDGKEVLFNESLSELNYHKRFYEKGVKLHSFIVSSGWVGNNKFDYTVTDRVMDAAASIGDDVKLLPRVKLNPPVEWCKENPEELFVYYDGPRDKDEIQSVVGTAEHDYIGYDAPDGYYMGNPKFNRPNRTGSVARQSFTSEKWLKDAKDALVRFIKHVEKRYPGKILGYHVAYGTSGETILWGRIDANYGDYGIDCTKKFDSYLKENYNFSSPLPAPDERYLKKDTLKDFLRVENKTSVYFDEFTSKVNARATEEFCKTVKEVSPNSVTGVFYGYLMVDNIVYTGHTDIDTLVNSPYVDFFAAPKAYYRCTPGDSGGDLSVPQSINLKKTWVDECDVRTHLAQKSDDSTWLANDIVQTKNAILRELSKNLSHDSGLWLMDLGGGWYDDDDMMEFVGEVSKINELVRKRPLKSASDVLVLIDENSIAQAGVSEHCFTGYCSDFICNTKKTGVLVDTFRLSDIRKIDLSNYKAIVFGYTLKINPEDIEYIKANSDAAFVFNYAAGCISEGNFSLSNTEKLTGFELEESGTVYDFPNIKIVNHSNLLLENEYGNVASKMIDGRVCVMNTVPYIDVHTLRKIYELAGCHIYSPENTVVYGDKRFVTVLSDGKEYDDFINLTKPSKWENLLTGETGFSDKVKLTLKPFEAAMLLLDN